MRQAVLREKGQVSLEMLLLAAIILLFSVGVISYYTQISDSTMALYLLDTETLKEIDEAGEIVVKEGIEYKIDTATDTLELCLFTKSVSGNDLLDAADITRIENLIEDNTNFATVNLYEKNDNPCT